MRALIVSYFVLEGLFEIRMNGKYNGCLRMLKGMLAIMMILNCFLANFPVFEEKAGEEMVDMVSKWQKTCQNAELSLEELETMVENQDWEERVQKVVKTADMQEKLQNTGETDNKMERKEQGVENENDGKDISIGEISIYVE